MTKPQVASESRETGKTPGPGQQATTAEYPALGDEPEEAEDVFKEIPTVANRARPATSSPEDGKAGSTPAEGAGAYRILHPMTSDVLDTPAPDMVEPSAAKRMVLGPARKPK